MTIYNLQPRNVHNTGYSFLAHKTSKYEKMGWDACHTLKEYRFVSPSGSIVHGWNRHTFRFFREYIIK